MPRKHKNAGFGWPVGVVVRSEGWLWNQSTCGKLGGQLHNQWRRKRRQAVKEDRGSDS